MKEIQVLGIGCFFRESDRKPVQIAADFRATLAFPW
jgi:hypothetical protein